jgi:hypothetical protein
MIFVCLRNRSWDSSVSIANIHSLTELSYMLVHLFTNVRIITCFKMHLKSVKLLFTLITASCFQIVEINAELSDCIYATGRNVSINVISDISLRVCLILEKQQFFYCFVHLMIHLFILSLSYTLSYIQWNPHLMFLDLRLPLI